MSKENNIDSITSPVRAHVNFH